MLWRGLRKRRRERLSPLGNRTWINLRRGAILGQWERLRRKADSFSLLRFTTEMRWDAPSRGLHTLQVKVYDAAGLSTSADDAADPKALMLNVRRGASQSLAFEPEVR